MSKTESTQRPDGCGLTVGCSCDASRPTATADTMPMADGMRAMGARTCRLRLGRLPHPLRSGSGSALALPAVDCTGGPYLHYPKILRSLPGRGWLPVVGRRRSEALHATRPCVRTEALFPPHICTRASTMVRYTFTSRLYIQYSRPPPGHLARLEPPLSRAVAHGMY